MRFLRDITFGQYMPGDSFLHRLDPRTKFISLLLLMITTFLIKGFPALVSLGVVFFLALVLSGLPWAYVFRGVRSFLWLFLFTAVVHFFFTPGPSLPFFPLGFVDVTWPGLEKGILVASQLLLAILFSSLLTLTTSPMRLVQGLENLITPLKRFHVPVEDFSLMALLAIRFIPLLFSETNRIIKAQCARGIDFESGNFLLRVKNIVPILTPLSHSLFKRADEMAIALMVRGYVRGAKRTHLHELKMTLQDYFVLAAVLGFVVWEMKI
jgi:energy-coupling factor transport system permease protein